MDHLKRNKKASNSENDPAVFSGSYKNIELPPVQDKKKKSEVLPPPRVIRKITRENNDDAEERKFLDIINQTGGGAAAVIPSIPGNLNDSLELSPPTTVKKESK